MEILRRIYPVILAVSIGQMLGANIVITGNITGSGKDRRLILKALDVKTAQIIAMTRENI